MSTKKDKNSFIEQSFTTSENQYYNLNLNQYKKCPILVPVQSYSKSNNDEYCATDNCEEKEKFQSWNKSFTTLNGENYNSRKLWKNKTNLNITNKSILSLHISAYKNETASNLFDDENIEGLKKERLESIKNSKHCFTDCLMNPFEFPRQQNGDQKNKPEVTQFKASQQLVGSQHPTRSQQIGNNVSIMDLDSTLPDLTSDEAAFSKLKFIVEKTINDLSIMDAVDVGISQNESLRSFKAKLKHVLINWPNYEDLIIKEPWQELIEVLNEFKSIEKAVTSYDAVVVAAKDSKSEFVFGQPYEKEAHPAHIEKVSVEEWPSKMSSKRRQNLCVHCQLYGHSRPYCPNIDKPAVCHKCGRDDHIAIFCQSFDQRHCRLCAGKHLMINCEIFNGKCYKHFGEHMYLECPDYVNRKSRSSICAACKQEGHMAKDCEYNLCVHCQLYGHSRPYCPNIDKPAVCYKCGEYNHIAVFCQSFDQRHCHLCAGKHFMVNCEGFNGKCYKHFGEHMYRECPDYINRNSRSRFYR
uniref:CCHC-type domain-containing protein n=1 Tax=Panagrolaimus sp. PS1159 TaxID=55785 RepID=A0AC35EXC6_9BILA